MRKILVPQIVLGCLMLFPLTQSYAQGKFGAGFIIGDPSGFAWNYRLSPEHAIDGAIGISPFDEGRIHADYLWLAYPFQDTRWSLHYGVGAAVGFGRTEEVFYDGGFRRVFVHENDLGFGVRGVIGVSYLIPKSPVDLFAEVGPLVVLTSPSGVGVDGGLGARFYFR